MNRILYNVTGQTLVHYPLTRAASATYSLERLDRSLDDAARVIASGAATVSTVSTTTDAAAGPAQTMATKVPVVATTSIAVGDRLEITDPSGIAEVFEVDTIVSGDYLLATHPLIGTYASGSTVKGIKISAAMHDVTAQDETFVEGSSGPLRVVWKYTIEGVLHHVQDQIPIVRHTHGDTDIGDAIATVVDAFPEIAARLKSPTKLHQWARFCERDLARRMRTKGDDPALYLTGDQGVMLLVWRLVLHAADNGLAPGNRDISEWAVEARKRFDGAWDGAMGVRAGQETLDVNKATDTAGNHPSLRARGALTFGG